MGIKKGKYDVELIRRTGELIESYEGKYNLTLLMNALLSLIVLPSEYNKQKNLKFLNVEISQIKEIEFLLNSPGFYFDPQNRNNDLKNLLRRVRNGIAHQRIEAVSKNNKWTGVIIQDADRNNNIGLNLQLTTKQLRMFARYIESKYLEEVNK